VRTHPQSEGPDLERVTAGKIARHDGGGAQAKMMTLRATAPSRTWRIASAPSAAAMLVAPASAALRITYGLIASYGESLRAISCEPI
jgi:hypothetical protein